MLKYILLGFLNYDSMTGYDLKNIMETTTMHFWHAYHSQIYTTLRKLEETRLLSSEIESDDDEKEKEKLNRRVYTITEAGRAELKVWLDDALTSVVPAKEDLLVRMFFSAQRNRQDVLTELHIQRQLHQKQLESYQEIRTHLVRSPFSIDQIAEDIQADVPFWSSTLQFGIAYERMYLQWLEDTILWLEERSK